MEETQWAIERIEPGLFSRRHLAHHDNCLVVSINPICTCTCAGNIVVFKAACKCLSKYVLKLNFLSLYIISNNIN